MPEKILSQSSGKSVILIEGNDGKVFVIKKFHDLNLLNKEWRIHQLLNCAVPTKKSDNSLIYPYLKSLKEFAKTPYFSYQVLDILKQGVAILAELKTKNLVHRDFKPSNFFIDENATNKLFISDFETILEMDDVSQNSCGTPGYMAPEQYEQVKVDWLADQYSLGAVFYFLLTGTNPFQGDSKEEFYSLQKKYSPNPMTVNVKLQQSICLIVEKMMSVNKNDRFQSIEDIYSALDNCAKALQPKTILEGKSVQIKPVKKSEESRWWFIFLVILALLLAAIAFEIL